MSSVVTICNQALSQVPAGPITSLDESSVPARACKLWYAQVLSELMAKGTGWQFATKRVALAQVESDRMGEWLAMAGPPADMVFPRQVLDSAGLGPHGYLWQGGKLYTNVIDAQIEYVTNQTLTDAYGGLFRAAFIARLAERLVMPITKDRRRQVDLIQAAETAEERALAFNQNLNPPSYMNHTPDVVLGRMGELWPPVAFEGPEATYPDFDPVGVFDSELDT